MKKIFISILLLSSSLNAQELDRLIEEGDRLFTHTNRQLKFPKNQLGLEQLVFFSPLDTARNSHYLELQLLEIEKQQFRQDIGLQFKALANYNFRDVINEETNNFNLGTIRAELEWNVLRSGYSNNRIQGKIKENQFRIQSNALKQNEKILQRRKFRVDYTYAINQEKLYHLEKQLKFQNQYFDFLNKLYFQKYLKREKLIQVSHEISVLEGEIQHLKKENLTLKDSVSVAFQNLKSMPLLSLNLDSIDVSDSYFRSNIILESNNIKLRHKAINDLSLSFYVQENYNYSRAAQRFFPSIGFRFKAPIRLNQRKKIIDTKIKILNAQSMDKSVGRNNKWITAIKSYNEKLKDLKNQYKNWQILEERIRVLTVLKSEINDKDTGILLLENTHEKFKVLANVIQLKRQLYTLLSQILELANWDNIEDIATLFQFENKEKKSQQFLIKNDPLITLDTQLNYYLLNQKHIQLFVNKGDIAIQQKLKQERIKYGIATKGVTTLIEEIQRNATQLNIKL